ncbi:zinc-ribbon domain-containing protein [Paenibacillus agricola]
MCGNKIKITCRNCGNELPDGSLFCTQTASQIFYRYLESL